MLRSTTNNQPSTSPIDFPAAVQFVRSALRDLQEQGVELRASSAALERLKAITARAPKTKAPSASEGDAPARKLSDFAPAPAASAIPAAPAALPATIVSAAAVALPGSDFPRLPVPDGTKAEKLAAMRGPVLACVKCPHLVASRTQVVFGVGNPDAELMFVGEAPGEDEDLQGEPFVGKAGQLLTKIIETMGFKRADVYIANVLKCRPDMPPGMPGNRKPKPAEMQTCLPYLRQQIEVIQPRAIVALGATAMEGLLGATESMSRLRGRWHDFQGTPLMATYHPAYLLRNQSLSEKRKVWEDMLLVLERLGKPISEKQRGYFLGKTG